MCKGCFPHQQASCLLSNKPGDLGRFMRVGNRDRRLRFFLFHIFIHTNSSRQLWCLPTVRVNCDVFLVCFVDLFYNCFLELWCFLFIMTRSHCAVHHAVITCQPTRPDSCFLVHISKYRFRFGRKNFSCSHPPLYPWKILGDWNFIWVWQRNKHFCTDNVSKGGRVFPWSFPRKSEELCSHHGS